MIRRKIKAFTAYWLPVLIWAGFIFTMSSIPGEDILPLFAFQDIVYHLVVYFILAWLLMRALNYSYKDLSSLRRFFLAFVIGLIYALSDEFHQGFVTERYPTLLDVSIDGIGLFIGAVIYKREKLKLFS